MCGRSIGVAHHLIDLTGRQAMGWRRSTVTPGLPQSGT